jgi:hypothetical protein
MTWSSDPCAGHDCDYCPTCTGADGGEPRCCGTQARPTTVVRPTGADLAAEMTPTGRFLNAIQADRHRRLASLIADVLSVEPAALPPGPPALAPGSFDPLTVRIARKDTTNVRPPA